MIRSLWQTALPLALLSVAAFAQPNETRKSIARITTTAQGANYRVPWLPGQVGGMR